MYLCMIFPIGSFLIANNAKDLSLMMLGERLTPKQTGFMEQIEDRKIT